MPARTVIALLCAVLPMAALSVSTAAEPLVIAASPSTKAPVEALGRLFETSRPDVKVLVYVDNGLDLRRTIAAMENSPVGGYALAGKGPIHLVAPGGDELIKRLESRRYVYPGTARAYATERLVLVVPEALVEAPTSFEGISGRVSRLAVADPERTVLGLKTKGVLQSLGFSGQLDVATDAGGVLDHVLGGQADAGIIFGHEAVKEQERVRIAAVAGRGYEPTVHSMAMERHCPDRRLCEDFLAFIQSEGAGRAVKALGYGTPPVR